MNTPQKISNERKQVLLLALARGEQAIAENRIYSHTQAKEKLSRWLK